MQKFFKKYAVKHLLIFSLFIGALLFSNMLTVSAEETNGGSVERIDGATRETIATTISERGWASSDVVFLANGFKEADILTGSPLARVHDAPILFTRDNYLPDVTLNEIQRLGASKVIILGGSTSVPQHIVDTLDNNNLEVERINGQSRYDLAANIAEEVIKSEGGQKDAYVVNGDAYADAISIAPIAANRKQPIYLTRSNKLHPEVKNNISDSNAWNIIGGTNSIPKNVVGEMQNTGAKITNRFDGHNRYAVNRNIISHYGNTKDYTYVASGEILADALATSVLAGKESANILLVKNNNIGNLANQIDFIKNKITINDFILVGGKNTLSSTTERYFKSPGSIRDIEYAKEFSRSIWEYDDFRLSNTGMVNGFSVSGYEKYESLPVLENLVLPDVGINGKPIVGIENYAFYGYEVWHLKMPDTITSIHNDAFLSSDLITIELSDNLKSIGDRAFQNNSINILELPNTVESIGAKAFSNSNLLEVTMSTGIKSIHDSAFRNTSFTSIDLPNDLDYLGDNVFDSDVKINYQY